MCVYVCVRVYSENGGDERTRKSRNMDKSLRKCRSPHNVLSAGGDDDVYAKCVGEGIARRTHEITEHLDTAYYYNRYDFSIVMHNVRRKLDKSHNIDKTVLNKK